SDYRKLSWKELRHYSRRQAVHRCHAGGLRDRYLAPDQRRRELARGAEATRSCEVVGTTSRISLPNQLAKGDERQQSSAAVQPYKNCVQLTLSRYIGLKRCVWVVRRNDVIAVLRTLKRSVALQGPFVCRQSHPIAVVILKCRAGLVM